uniref:Uncharacterized protein n=1 Tax=Vespula pensylvanica TaxID=30213 RepID=A0A834P1Y5_VESPE|nr:hypothetical protein H0235_007781 [Vespula pensylvanica]
MVMAAADLDESFVRFFLSAGSDMHNESFALEGSCGPRADTRIFAAVILSEAKDDYSRPYWKESEDCGYGNRY